MRNVLLMLVLISAGLASGCGTFIYLYAQKDRDYQPQKEPAIFVLMGSDIGVAEKNFASDLTSELKRSGFNVAKDQRTANFILRYTLQQKARYGWYFVSQPLWYFPHHYYGHHPFYHYRGYYAYHYPPIAYPYLYKIHRIRLKLYDAAKFNNGERVAIWEGLVDLTTSEYKNDLLKAIRLLIEHFGRNYDGQIRLNN